MSTRWEGRGDRDQGRTLGEDCGVEDTNPVPSGGDRPLRFPTRTYDWDGDGGLTGRDTVCSGDRMTYHLKSGRVPVQTSSPSTSVSLGSFETSYL